MRTAFTNEMTIHVWAQQTQEHGHNTNGTLRFINTALYSYATPIANFITYKGVRYCLVTNRTYSTTTSTKHMPSSRDIPCKAFYVKHLGVTGGRAPHWPMSYDDMPSVHKANIEDMSKQYNDLILRMARARSNAAFLANEIKRNKLTAMEYNSTFDVNADINSLFPDPDPALLKQKLDEAKAEAKDKADITRRANEAKAASMQAAVELYINGHTNELPWEWVYNCSKEQKEQIKLKQIEYWRKGLVNRIDTAFQDKTLLRIESGVVATSRGAEFPIDHAKKAFAIILRCKERNESWARNGKTIHLGHFQIDAISQDGTVKAGCHEVEYSEIERIAKQLGLI